MAFRFHPMIGFLSTLAVAGLGGVGSATAGPACGAPTAADRAAVLDALRAPVAAVLHERVEFRVEQLRQCGDWAFAMTTPQRPSGGEPRWVGTPCEGDTSHLAGGLVHREGGTWRLVEYALCPSDVAWADWPERFRTPSGLFDE